MSTVGNFNWNHADSRGVKALFAAIKFNIFTFILLLFSTHIIYIPVLREYAKLGFDYGNTILVFALIIYLILLPFKATLTKSKNRRKN
tara:strand:+ start:78 stop:341 length:264 start_codon:yes stop_codon:yes gene_type:complete